MDTWMMNRGGLAHVAVGIAMVAGLCLACSDPPTSTGATTYPVGGMVTGLVGSGLVLRNNGGDDFAVTGNGTFTFATPVSNGAAFDVTVFAQPTSPVQTCVVTDGSGTMSGANVTNVAIACTTNGTLRVTVATTGPDAPATYPVYGDPPRAYIGTVPSNGTVSVTLGSGHHTVSLLVARNCTVAGSNDVWVTAGARTDIAFSVTCLANPTINVSVSTTGTYAPANYLLWVSDPFHPRRRVSVPSNGTVSFKVSPGSSTLALSVPLDCTVIGNTQHVIVAPGATTSVTFRVNCGPPGTLAVTALTTGSNAPATYLVGIDSLFRRPQGYRYQYIAFISSNGTLSQILPPGSHTVNLLVPVNCAVTGPNNVSVTVASGATTDLGFTVSCQ